MNIGEIQQFCFHRENINIPFGYLECDGVEITESEYPDLFYHLSENFDEEKIKLPIISRQIIDDKYIILTLIRYTENSNKKTPNYNAEFKIEENNIIVTSTIKDKKRNKGLWRKKS